MKRAVRTAPRGTVCSLCRSESPRLGCPRCDARQLQLFAPMPPLAPDDGESVTIAEMSALSRRERELAAARIARLKALERTIQVGLVGCTKTKRADPAPCRSLYTSPLFVACLAHAEARCDETYVASAAHGLLALDATVAPYERTLRDLPKKERLAWGARIASALQSRFPLLPVHLLILAGLEYARPIQSGAFQYGWIVETPLTRLPIGARLSWLKSRAIPSAPRRRLAEASHER